MSTGISTPVADIMSRPVLTNETGETLGDAWQLMFVSGLRHLVVLDDDGVPFGVLSDRAVLAGSPSTIDHWGNLLVRDVLARVPRGSIRPDSTAQQAVHEMSHRAVEALPVTEEGGKLVGILTESDVVRWVGTAA